MLFTGAMPPIIWMITLFDINYRLITAVDDPWADLIAITPRGAAVRAVLLGIWAGVAMVVAGIGWRLLRKRI
jgi:hypothetical protein